MQNDPSELFIKYGANSLIIYWVVENLFSKLTFDYPEAIHIDVQFDTCKKLMSYKNINN